MIEIIGGTWAAGETKTFHINGEYLEILDCQYTCDVMLMDKVGAQLSTMKDCEASFFSRPKEGFNTVQIRSAQAQFLRVFVGSGDAGTRRISSTVQVIDGERARVLGGSMYVANSGAVPAAGNFGRCQLWNPAGSGQRLVVSSLYMSAPTAQPVNMLFQGAKIPGSNVTVVNKLAQGAPAGVGQAVKGQSVAGLGDSMWGGYLQGGVVLQWAPKGVLMLPPGYGLTVEGGTAATAIAVNFEWFEESI